MTSIKKRLESLIDRRASEWLDEQSVRLGKDTTQVIETGKPGVLWARLANGRPIKIHVGTADVPSRFNLRLKVGRKKSQPAIWQVIYTQEDYDAPAGGGELTYHHRQHEEDGGDRLNLSWKQIVARSVRVKDAAGFIVRVFGDPDLTVNGWALIPTQDLDLSSYVPTTGALFVAIESDDDGALSINDGTPFAAPGIGTAADYPEPAAGNYTRALVLLFEGQTALLDRHIIIPKPPSFNPVAFSESTHNHDSRYPRKYTGKTAAPGVNDDSGDGYAVDDIWVDETNDKAYVAVDVTVGAAVWVEMGGSGGSGTPGGSDTQLQFNDGGSFGGARLDYSYGSSTSVVSAERSGDHGDFLQLNGADADNDGNGGGITFGGGSAPGDGNAGTANIYGGNASGLGDGGDVLFTPGDSVSGAKGRILFRNPGTADTVQLLLNGISANRVLSAPNASGVIALTSDIPAVPTTENIEDIIGAMVSGNTETGIAVTYDDIGAKLNFDAQTAGDARYAPIAKGVTNGDSHDHSGGDGAQIDHTTLSNIGTNTHAQIDTFIGTTAPATYAPIAKGVTNGDSHDHNGGDGAQINHTTLSNIGTNTHAQIDTHIASTSNPHSVTAAQAGAIPTDGWQAASQSWTYASADDPIYQVYVSGDVTADANYKLGNKIKCTNNSTTFYGFIMKVGAYDSGNNRTPVDVYGGTDYDLANSAITAPYISKVKSPDGFPTSPAKWTVETNTSNSPAKSSPTVSTWYGGAGLSPTGPSIDLPIGAWKVFYKVTADYSTNLAAVSNIGLRVTLSTANNSESDPEMTTGATNTLPISTTALQRATYEIPDKLIAVTSKTTYYVNMFSGSVTGTGPTFTMNAGGVFRNIIRAVCAYL